MKWLLTMALLAVMLPRMAQAQNTEAVRWCTGHMTGNYHWSADQIKAQIGAEIPIELVQTTGSLMNLQRLMTDNCDIAFAQQDVVDQYGLANPLSHNSLAVVKVVYEEYVQILCPAISGWKSLSDLANASGRRRLIIGKDGSGIGETWRMMRILNTKYDAIERVYQTTDARAINAVMHSKDTCMMWVSGLNSSDMITANNLSMKNGKPTLQLLTIDDDAVFQIKGSNGKPLYRAEVVGSGVYSHLVNGKSVRMAVIEADLVVRRDAISRPRLDRIIRAIVDLQPVIWARVNPAAD